jgi:hypothetical protein
VDDGQGGARVNEVAQTLSRLARSLEVERDLDALLHELVDAAVAQIPGADEASVSIVQARRKVVPQSPSSELPKRIDALQTEVKQGPCLDAAFRERVVRVPDLAHETRWPQFCRRAADAGLGSMLSFRLWVEGDDLGVLNLYGRRPEAFDQESEDIGLLFVSHAAVAMAGLKKYDQLNDSIDTRDLIGQAKGILMERYQVDDLMAFALLVRASQHTNAKVRDVASELCRTGAFTPAPQDAARAPRDR